MGQNIAQLMSAPDDGRIGAVKAGTNITIGPDGTICSTGGGGGGGFWCQNSCGIYPSDLNYNVGIGTSSPANRFFVESKPVDTTYWVACDGVGRFPFLGQPIPTSFQSVLYDSLGNLYALGSDWETQEWFLIKYNTLGEEVWRKGFSHCYISDIAVDTSDNSVFLVFNNPENYYVTPGDGTLLKLDADGNVVWQTNFSESSGKTVDGSVITLSSTGDIYVAGTIWPYSLHLPSEMVLMKFNSSGVYQWGKTASTALSTSGYRPVPWSVVVDGSGNICMTGTIWDAISYYAIPTTFTFKFNPSGNFLSGTSLAKQVSPGQYSMTEAVDSVMNSQGDTYIILEDKTLVKLDSSGSLVWAREVGEGGYPYYSNHLDGLFVDSNDNLYASGGVWLNDGNTLSLTVYCWDSSDNLLWQRGFLCPVNSPNYSWAGALSEFSGKLALAGEFFAPYWYSLEVSSLIQFPSNGDLISTDVLYNFVTDYSITDRTDIYIGTATYLIDVANITTTSGSVTPDDAAYIPLFNPYYPVETITNIKGRSFIDEIHTENFFINGLPLGGSSAGSYNNFIAGDGAGYIGFGAYCDQNQFIGTLTGANEIYGYGNTFLGQSAGKGTPGPRASYISEVLTSTCLPGCGGLYPFYAETVGNYSGVYGWIQRDGDGAISNYQPGYRTLLRSCSWEPVTEGDVMTIPGGYVGGINGVDDVTVKVGAEGTYNSTTQSVFIGNYAAAETYGCAYQNIAIGAAAGLYSGVNNEFNNIFIGSGSGMNNWGGFYNTAIGAYAGQYAGGWTSFSNTFIGTFAGMCTSNNFYQTVVGAYAGMNMNTNDYAIQNTLFGAFAGHELTTGVGNSLSGSYAGNDLTTGSLNAVFGNWSLWGNTTGSCNAVFGNLSALKCGTGSNNSLFGHAAGSNVGGGDSGNTAIGSEAGRGSVNGMSYIYYSGGASVIPSESNVTYVIEPWQLQNTGIVSVTDPAYFPPVIEVRRDGSGAVNYVEIVDPGSRFGFYLSYFNSWYPANKIRGSLVGGVDGVDDITVSFGADFSTCAGFDNTFIGNCAGLVSDQGCRNFYGGFRSGTLSNCTHDNVAIGSYSSFYGGGYNNIFLGHKSGYGSLGCYASGNVYIGSCVGYYGGGCYTFGNVSIGAYSGLYITESTKNVFLGYVAGLYNTTGDDNTFIGNAAGYGNTTGFENVFIGRYSGRCNTTGNTNTFVGPSSGVCNSTGSENTYLGKNSGKNAQTGSKNTYLGNGAGYNAFFGSRNVAIGEVAAFSLNNGSCNVFIGNYAGTFSTGGDGNTVVGSCAGYSHLIGSYGNSAFGARAGRCNTTASGNTTVGWSAGEFTTTGESNTFIGRAAGYGNTTGWANTAIGCGTGVCNTTGCCNVFIGSDSGGRNTTGFCNIFIGQHAAYYNTAGCNNVIVGQRAGYFNTTGNYNTFEGFCTGYSNTTGSYNNFTGFWTGRCNTVGKYNNFYGSISGEQNTTGCYNTFMGHQAGQWNTTGSRNSFFGHLAGQCNTGSFNAGVGNGALRYATGCFNAALGHFAGGIGSRPASCNIYLGYYSGPISGGQTGTNNTFIGFRSGCAVALNSTSSNNIAIGCLSGGDAVLNLTTQSNQIVMGNNAHTNAYIKVNWTVTSDERDKTCITPIRHGSNFLNQLTPIQYNWKDRESGEVTEETPRYGFLAQEILAAEGDPAVLVDDHDPENLKLRETMMIPVLVKAFQELSEKYEELANELALVKSQLG